MIYDPDFANTCLYILMRMDMDSMTPGKAMAQAAHAANQFVDRFGSRVTPGYEDWKMGGGDGGARAMDMVEGSGTYGFGTTIVLGVESLEQLRYYLRNAMKLEHPVGMVLDPTYPVRDGRVTHLVPVHTCGFIFIKNRDDNGGALFEGLTLHP